MRHNFNGTCLLECGMATLTKYGRLQNITHCADHQGQLQQTRTQMLRHHLYHIILYVTQTMRDNLYHVFLCRRLPVCEICTPMENKGTIMIQIMMHNDIYYQVCVSI